MGARHKSVDQAAAVASIQLLEKPTEVHFLGQTRRPLGLGPDAENSDVSLRSL